jgi:RNA-binding protein Nova
MRSLGYSDSANTEVCAALGILAKYGVLGVGMGLANGTHTQTQSNPLSYLNVSALEQQQSQQTVGNIFGAIGGNLESFINSQQQQQQRNSLERFEATFDPFRNAQATAPITLNNNNFGLTNAQQAQALNAAQSLGALSKSPTPGEIGSKDAKNVEIPEVIVGAILGKFQLSFSPQTKSFIVNVVAFCIFNHLLNLPSN